MNSQAKERVSRRTKRPKRDRIRKYADEHGLTYSEAQERLLLPRFEGRAGPGGRGWTRWTCESKQASPSNDVLNTDPLA